MGENIDALFEACKDVSSEDREAALLSAREQFPNVGVRVLRYFLARSSFDLNEASPYMNEYNEWRKANLPVERTAEVAKLLNSARYRWLGFNRDKQGVVIFNCMRGKFMDGASSHSARLAYIAHLEDAVAKVDAEPDSKFGLVHIVLNGMPPLSLIKDLTPVVGKNFPGRLQCAVVVLPAALHHIGQGVITFLKESVQRRVAFASSKEQLLQLANFDPEKWPDDLDPDTWNPDQEWWNDTRPNGDRVQYVRQCIEAGKAEQIEVTVTSSADVCTSYEVMVEEEDIDVGVVFEIDEGVAELDTQRLIAGTNMTGDVDPTWTGVIRFELDNTYSWFTRKAVTAMVITKSAS